MFFLSFISAVLSRPRRSKYNYGMDTINSLNLIESTKIPVRRNLRWGIKRY